MALIIETRALRREFGQTAALSGVELAVEAGSVLALVGPNGAGKTTLLRVLAALLEPTSGSAAVGGHDVRENPREVHACLGYLPDFFGLYEDMVVRDYLRYFCLAYHIMPEAASFRISRALELVGLADKAREPIESLSRGMKQRVGLARTLLHDPPLLLLDEPAAGLDPGARHDLQQLLQSLARQGKTIVVSSHILAELEDYCSHVAILDGGRLRYAGSIADARAALSGGGRRYRLRLLERATEAERLLKASAGVTAWQAEPGGGTFQLQGGEAEAAGLLGSLVAAGLPVASFAEVAGTIQDSYLHLLGREVR